jgi:antitoxin (DNA-binding transcriptional repressor) of toxin-antitoxin stability system
LKGEHIVVTRRGQPVIEFKPVQAEGKQDDATPRWTVEEQLEWLRARRVGRKPAKTDAATLVRQMRDEEWR